MKLNVTSYFKHWYLISLVLLAGCGASTYKKATVSFAKSTSETFLGYEYLLNQQEHDLLKKHAITVDGDLINTEDRFLSDINYSVKDDIKLRHDVVKGMLAYSKGLSELASVGLASTTGKGIVTLGAQMESAGNDVSKNYGKLFGFLGNLLIDHKVGKSVSSTISKSDMYVQKIIEILLKEIAESKSALYNSITNDWNEQRSLLNKKSCTLNETREQNDPCTEGFNQSKESGEMIIKMYQTLEQRKKISLISTNTVKALENLSKSHTSLTQKARGKGKKNILQNIKEFVSASGSLKDAIDSI